MWKKLKNKNKGLENPEPAENPENQSGCETEKLNPVKENESENHENPEIVEPNPESSLSAEEISGEGIEKLTDTLNAAIESDDSSKETLEMLLEFVKSLADGTVDKEILQTLQKGLDYEADIEKARAEGEIAGRNATIIEEFASREADTSTDEVPNLSGSFSSPNASRGNSIFDLARSART